MLGVWLVVGFVGVLVFVGVGLVLFLVFGVGDFCFVLKLVLLFTKITLNNTYQ